MASFRLRSNKWQARVSVQGYPTEVKSFDTKAEAQQWARKIESSMDAGSFRDRSTAKTQRLFDVLERYKNEVTPSKRGAVREAEGIRFMQRHKMALHSMDKLSPTVIAGYRDERLKTVSAGTIIRELAILSSIISYARTEWSLQVDNPCELVRRPPSPAGRTRLLTAEEEEKLLHELRPVGKRSKWMIPLVRLALQTAMRRGELLALRWENIDLARQVAILPLTKNGSTRVVPLSTKAVAILLELPRNTDGFVFKLSIGGLEVAFKKACKRAGIVDLHFHDLRHTATSHMAEKLPNVIELASVTGHQTIQMLKRYYHPKAEVLAKKLG